MKTLLRIDASFNTLNSFSRNAADYYEKLWKWHNPNGHIIYRDIDQLSIPHLSQEVHALFYDATYSGQKRFDSDHLIEELISADDILISCPVYNFSVPSKLKVYIDHIVRINRTFEYDPKTYERRGLLADKLASVIVARGGVFSNEDGDGVEDYLKKVLNYIGITKITSFSISETAFENADLRLEEVKSDIKNFFKTNLKTTAHV